MSMNGIDISSWQTGINLNAVPCDFAIVKATGGTGYVNPDFTRAMNQAVNAGKKVGDTTTQERKDAKEVL